MLAAVHTTKSARMQGVVPLDRENLTSHRRSTFMLLALATRAANRGYQRATRISVAAGQRSHRASRITWGNPVRRLLLIFFSVSAL